MSRIIFIALLTAALTASAAGPATGWVESARAQFACTHTCPPPVGAIDGRFVVPPNPVTPSGDVLFFIGAQPNDASSIVQTVLQFKAGGWTVANVQNFGVGKPQHSSNAIQALAGDTITTSISCQCRPDGTKCTCDLAATNLRTNETAASPLPQVTISSPLTSVYGGVLEVDHLAGCAALPPSHSIKFTSTIKDTAGKELKPSRWITRRYNIGVKCNFAVEGQGDTVTLSW